MLQSRNPLLCPCKFTASGPNCIVNLQGGLDVLKQASRVSRANLCVEESLVFILVLIRGITLLNSSL